MHACWCCKSESDNRLDLFLWLIARFGWAFWNETSNIGWLLSMRLDIQIHRVIETLSWYRKNSSKDLNNLGLIARPCLQCYRICLRSSNLRLVSCCIQNRKQAITACPEMIDAAHWKAHTDENCTVGSNRTKERTSVSSSLAVSVVAVDLHNQSDDK